MVVSSSNVLERQRTDSVRSILDKALDGGRISEDEAVTLLR